MKSCVCYVIDDNYLFPTLVSAIQARAQVPEALSDVVIICITDTPARTQSAAAVAQEYGIELVIAPTKLIDNMHPMYGRLFVDRILPPEYERIVYIDGDTQIMGSLKPLIEVQIKNGHFLAARDPSGMFARLSSKWMTRILHDREEAGIKQNYDDYFNTGVLVFDRKDWVGLAQKTLETIRNHTGRFKYGDQDPMNLAVGDKCIYLSNKWNFPGFLIGSTQEKQVKPVVYHFMSNPRPWTHAVAPWGAKWQAPYIDLLRKHKVLASLAPKASGVDRVKYQLQQLFKVATEYNAVGQTHESISDVYL